MGLTVIVSGFIVFGPFEKMMDKYTVHCPTVSISAATGWYRTTLLVPSVSVWTLNVPPLHTFVTFGVTCPLNRCNVKLELVKPLKFGLTPLIRDIGNRKG